MTKRLLVDFDHLSTSATQVLGRSVDFADSSSRTQRQLAAATGGWAGQSVAALTAFSARMAADSEALVYRSDDLSERMQSAVHRYAINEWQRATDIGGLDPTIGGAP